jgi:hypothetical protein
VGSVAVHVAENEQPAHVPSLPRRRADHVEGRTLPYVTTV